MTLSPKAEIVTEELASSNEIAGISFPGKKNLNETRNALAIAFLLVSAARKHPGLRWIVWTGSIFPSKWRTSRRLPPSAHAFSLHREMLSLRLVQQDKFFKAARANSDS